MNAFPKDLLVDIRKHLEAEKEDLTKRIAELTVQDPFSDPERASDNAASDTEAAEEADHDRNAAITDELKQKFTEISDAIARIDDGTYGFCTNCRSMIDTDRLGILPMATLCKTCEEVKKITIKT